MKLKLVMLIALSLILALTGLVSAQNQADKSEKPRDMKDEIEQSEKAAKVFREIMEIPDKAIPQSILDDAECVAVFPDVIKAGFIVGGRGGRGLASCRLGNTWSAPAYLNLGGGSIGLQIGAQSTDFVLLMMNKEGADSLMKTKFTLGGDASVAAGPVGRQAGASTDLALNAQILSYSRSKGLFAGLELKGVVVETDEDDMRDAYGTNITTKEVLKKTMASVPAGIRVFPETLAKFSARSDKKAAR
jgi:lipid-binding SYLF domain-containing protein